MAKNGPGHKWYLTPKRREKAIKLLSKGYSVSSVALVLDTNGDTLARHLKEAGINPKELHQLTLNKLQVNLLNTIENELEPEDRVKHGLKYLERYQQLEEEPEQVEVVSDNEIRMKILEELGK